MTPHDKTILPSWVSEEFFDLNVCRRARRKAREFSDPQTAWDAWDNAGEMIWLLSKRHADHRRMVRCARKMTEPMIQILIRTFTKGARFVETLYAVDCWLKKPSDSNAERVASRLPGMKGAAGGKGISYQTASAVRYLALGVFQRHELVKLPLEVSLALQYTSKQWRGCQPQVPQLLPHLSNDDLTVERIEKWLCDCVRKSFPDAPVLFSF